MSKNSGTNSRKSEDTPLNDQGIGLQQIYRMGEEASGLLNSPIYQLAHKMSVDQCILEMVETSPKERERRESLWHEIQAHGRAAEMLKGMVERAQQAIQQHEHSQHQKEQEYLDQQGFGLGDVASYQ